jgi:hypothetical protein
MEIKMDRKNRRLTFNKTFALNGTAEAAFALLGPEEEKDWLTGWDCEMMYPGPGSRVETDAVAISHPGTEREAIWVVVNRDEVTHNLELVRFEPGKMTLHLRIGVLDLGEISQMSWSMTVTALSDEIAIGINAQHPDLFEGAVGWIEESINHYLVTGSKLEKEPVH